VSDVEVNPKKPPVTLSESAGRRIVTIVEREKKGQMVRLAVNGGGCSGFQYSFSLDDKQNEDDLLIERDGACLLIDEISAGVLAGSEIDYQEDLMGASFTVRNPNASASCGCGSSFSVG
jgi:iron-sulfur cluster assembly accessory protein